MAPELPVAMPSGPFRNMGLSKAARTHRLRKLRTPAKCRECNSYVYFQGAECEEVSGAGTAGHMCSAGSLQLGAKGNTWRPRAPWGAVSRQRSAPGPRPGGGPAGPAEEPGRGAGGGAAPSQEGRAGQEGSGRRRAWAGGPLTRRPPARLPAAVLPGLPQEVPGHAGHPVRAQEAPRPPAALWPGLRASGPEHARRRALHHQEVCLRDRAAGPAHQGDRHEGAGGLRPGGVGGGARWGAGPG